MLTFFIVLGALILINILLLTLSNSLIYKVGTKKKSNSASQSLSTKIHPLKPEDSEFRRA
jgi:hypothetical protein